MVKIIFLFLFTGVNLCLVIGQSNLQNKKSEKDLPAKEDIDTLLKPVETLTNYLTNNISHIEINFALGIFFTNVHLKRIILDKGQNISYNLLTRIKAIVDKNEKSLLYFHKTAKDDKEFMGRDHVILSNLFVNSTYWMYRLKKLKYETKLTYSYLDLQNKYFEWQIYTENVEKVYQWIPSPKNSDTCLHVLMSLLPFYFSDICLVTLSINPKSKGNSTSWCPIANNCYTILKNGTNFGYALCQRLVLLLMAHLGRGCFILSVQEDEELLQKLCGMAYAEAEYIAMNGYGIVDLMFEIMCFCAIDGRVEFLRRTWLLKMVDFLNKNGCFGVDNRVMNQLAGCNSHTTGLASGTFAAAVRFILEEYS